MNPAVIDINFMRDADFSHRFDFVDDNGVPLVLTGWYFEAAVSAALATDPPTYSFSSGNGGIDHTDLAGGQITLNLARESIVAGDYKWDLIGINGLTRHTMLTGDLTSSKRGITTMYSTVTIIGGLERISIIKAGANTRVVTGGSIPYGKAKEFDEFTAAQIADKDHSVNTSGKRSSRAVYDTTNDRLMLAEGSAATDPWGVCDGSTQVVPS